MIRNAAKAIIIHNGKILLNKCENGVGSDFFGLAEGEIYYDLPGGGQEQFETIEEAVRRECLEETGYTLDDVRLAAIYEEISANADYRVQYADYAHKINFIFVCTLSDVPQKTATEVDWMALGCSWIDVHLLDEATLLPRAIQANIQRILQSDTIIFLGSDYL